MDDLAVVDTGTTGHYLTLNPPCDNKQQAVHPLPIQIPNGEIITSTHTALISHQDLMIQALRANIFFMAQQGPADYWNIVRSWM